MTSTIVNRVPRTEAIRIARHLRPAGTALDMWVSTQAVVVADDGSVLSPAVAVGAGEPPSDGVVRGGLVLVVELQTRAAQQWRVVDVPAIWTPYGDGAAVVRGGAVDAVATTQELTVDGYPTLRMPAALLGPGQGEVAVLHLHG